MVGGWVGQSNWWIYFFFFFREANPPDFNPEIPYVVSSAALPARSPLVKVSLAVCVAAAVDAACDADCVPAEELEDEVETGAKLGLSSLFERVGLPLVLGPELLVLVPLVDLVGRPLVLGPELVLVVVG